MKKLAKAIAGLATAAALFGAVGCKNQLTYVEETAELNKMVISGFYAEGLDSYNGYTAKLYVMEGIGEDAAAEEIYACEIAGQNEKSFNYKSGTAFIADEYLYDGEAFQNSKVTMYVEILKDKELVETIGVVNPDYPTKKDSLPIVDAKLSVVTSAAGTADENLAKRFVKMAYVGGGVAKFEFTSAVTEPTKANLYEINFSTLGLLGSKTIAEWNAVEGVKIETSPSTSAHPKYSIKVTGLTDDIGGKYGLRGAAITPKADGEPGDHWDQSKADEGLDAVVDANGEISFTFYGEHPSWDSGNVGPAFKVPRVGTLTDPWECLIYVDQNGNCWFPSDIGTNDVSLTLDYTKIAAAAKRFTAATKELNGIGEYAQPYYLDGYFLKGEFIGTGNWASEVPYLLQSPELDEVWQTLTYKVQFTATKADDYFAVVKNSDGSRYYGELEVADFGKGVFVELTGTADTMKSAPSTGIVNGNTYLLTVMTKSDGTVFAKIENYVPITVTLKFQVEGLTEGNEAWINGSMWTNPDGSDWALGWPAALGWNASVKDGYAPVEADPEGVAEFGSEFDVTLNCFIGADYSYGFKAVASKDGKWQKADWDSGNLKLEFTGKKSGTYIVSVDATNNKVTMTEQGFKIKGIKITNSPAIGAAGYIAFCSDWVPNNEWGASTTNKVTKLTNGSAVLNISPAKLFPISTTEVGIQILNPASDADFWADASKVGGGEIKASVPADALNKTYWLVVDASASPMTATLSVN